MEDIGRFSLREIQNRDLGRVLSWRNSERIRRFSYNDQMISQEEHFRWFQNLQRDSDTKKCLIFECETEPVGVVQFFQIDQKAKTCKWGFYLGTDELPKGTGTTMGSLALSYAFDALGLESIVGEAISHNEPSIRYHKKLGFWELGRVPRQVFRDGEWYDVILFELRREDFKNPSQILMPNSKEWQ